MNRKFVVACLKGAAWGFLLSAIFILLGFLIVFLAGVL